MSPLDIDRAVPVISADEDTWLESHGSLEREVAIAAYKAGSGKRTVTLEALQETALDARVDAW